MTQRFGDTKGDFMSDVEDISKLTDSEQLELLERTDNGPKSHEDSIKTAHLPQEPGSAVNNYERYPGPT